MKDIICSFMEHVLGNAVILAIIGGVVISLAAMTIMKDPAMAKEVVLISAGGVFGLAGGVVRPKNGNGIVPPKN